MCTLIKISLNIVKLFVLYFSDTWHFDEERYKYFKYFSDILRLLFTGIFMTQLSCMPSLLISGVPVNR